jgi:hypothetical protein
MESSKLVSCELPRLDVTGPLGGLTTAGACLRAVGGRLER